METGPLTPLIHAKVEMVKSFVYHQHFVHDQPQPRKQTDVSLFGMPPTSVSNFHRCTIGLYVPVTVKGKSREPWVTKDIDALVRIKGGVRY